MMEHQSYAVGSTLAGIVIIAIGSLLEQSYPLASSDSLPAWSLQLYLSLTLVALAFGLIAALEAVGLAAVVGSLRGRNNRPLPSLPIIYEG